MENKLSLSNPSVNWEDDLYNVDKIIDLPLSFISNINNLFNLEMLRTAIGRQLI